MRRGGSVTDVAVARAFSGAARHYDAHASVQLASARTLLAMMPASDAPGHAMDLGCGTLPLARALRERFPGRNWWAVDVSEAMLQQAEERGRLHGWQALRADAEALPFAANMFTQVYSSFALQWASSPQAVLKEVTRVLAPGGMLALSVPLAGTLQELKQSWARVDDGDHVNALATLPAWCGAAEAAGLALIHTQALTLTEHYADVRAVARGLKETGANVVRGRRRGLVSPARFRAMEAAYETLREARGLPLTWQTGFLLMEKR